MSNLVDYAKSELKKIGMIDSGEPKNHGDIVDLEAFSRFDTTVLLGAEKEDKKDE